MANVTRLSNQDWSHAYLEFMKSIGKELNRVPMIGDKAVDLRALLSQTVELGGFQKVLLGVLLKFMCPF
jgi:hypothetical protein